MELGAENFTFSELVMQSTMSYKGLAKDGIAVFIRGS